MSHWAPKNLGTDTPCTTLFLLSETQEKIVLVRIESFTDMICDMKKALLENERCLLLAILYISVFLLAG